MLGTSRGGGRVGIEGVPTDYATVKAPRSFRVRATVGTQVKCCTQGYRENMLRRLGLAKAPANGTNDGGKDAISVVSRPDPYVESRFFKVVYPGGVAVRSTPAEAAPVDGQVW